MSFWVCSPRPKLAVKRLAGKGSTLSLSHAEARQKIEQSLVEGKKALADAEKTVLAKSKECAEIADDYVRENPWTAVSVAAGVGLVLGLLMRGK